MYEGETASLYTCPHRADTKNATLLSIYADHRAFRLLFAQRGLDEAAELQLLCFEKFWAWPRVSGRVFLIAAMVSD